MAYLDYSLVELPDHAEGMRKIGDALEAAMRRRDARQAQEKELTFKREQEERRYRQQDLQDQYNNRLAQAREDREKREFGWREAEMQRRAATDARKASGPQEAEAIAVGAGGTLTPGELPDVGPAPTAPGAAPEAPPEIGAAVPDILQALRGAPGAFRNTPGAPPEIAARMKGLNRPQPEAGAMEGPQLPNAGAVRSAEIQRIATQPDTEEVPDIEAAVRDAEAAHNAQFEQTERYRRQFEPFQQEMERPRIEEGINAAGMFQRETAEHQGRVDAFPGEQQAYAAKQREAEGRRPYTLQFGDKPGATFDFQTQRTAKRQADASDFLASVGQMPLSPEDRQAAQIGHQMILSGQDPQKVFAQFQAERTLGAKQRFADQQGDKRDANRLEVAKVPRPGITLQTQRFDFDQQKLRSGNLRKDLENFVKRFDAKTIQDDNLSAPRIRDNLNSGNPERQRNAMIELWRMAQHDNRMSDRDAVMAQTVDPSWLSVIENAVSQKTTGVLSDDVRNTALATVDGFAKALGDKTSEMRSLARRNFIDSGEYGQHEADVLLGQQLPGWQRLFPDEPTLHGEKGAPPEVRAGRKAKAKGGKTTIKAPTVEEAEKALQLLQGAP